MILLRFLRAIWFSITNKTTYEYSDFERFKINYYTRKGYDRFNSISFKVESKVDILGMPKGSRSSHKVVRRILSKSGFKIKGSILSEGNSMFILSDKVVVEVYTSYVEFSYLERIRKERFKELLKVFYECKDILNKREDRTKIGLIASDRGGPEVLYNAINYSSDEGLLRTNYNEDLIEADQIIRDGINNKEGTGNLVILQSVPGCGKTHYIRNLIAREPKLDFIFLPNNQFQLLSDPSFTEFCIEDLKNTVLVIEDAEEILARREGIGRTNTVANILNLTDGILKDIINIKIICTINCSLDKIDEALLRKGRILCKYNFEKLSTEKSNELLKELGKGARVSEPTTLGDLYNIEDNSYVDEANEVKGFKIGG